MSGGGDRTGLEPALARTEADATEAVAASKRLQTELRAAERSAQTGDLRALRRAIGRLEETLADANEAVGRLQESWPLSEGEEVDLLASGSFVAELKQAARDADLGLYEQDEVLASYPSLLRVQAGQRAVTIDRKAYRHLRPSHLAAHLKELQEREPRLNAERFAGILHDAYKVIDRRGQEMVPLLDIHAALTLLPSARSDYSRQEFARDVYLLDGSGVGATKAGVPFRISQGATAARDRRKLLIVVTREGAQRTYYGIQFDDGRRS